MYEDGITISNPVIDANGDIYLALTFIYDNNHPAASDQIIFTAVAADGKVYDYRKTVPQGDPAGFQNGKYYYGSAILRANLGRRIGYGDSTDF